MAEEQVKAQVNQQLNVSIDVVVEDKRKYSFCMPYGASYAEAHTVSQEITQTIIKMAELAKEQQEKKEEDSKEEDVEK